MSSTEELHELIQTMSRAEIRSFRQMAGSNSKDGQNNYLKLFNVIRKHGDQGEETVRKKLRKESFVEHLATTRYQLSNLLIHSLCRYNSSNDPLAEVREGVQAVRLLFKRGQYDIGERLLKKLRQQAELHDYFSEQFELSRLERLTILSVQTAHKEELLQRHLEREREISQKITLQHAYLDLRNRIELISNVAIYIGDKNRLDKAKAIMSDRLLQDENLASTFLAKTTFFHIHFIYAVICGEQKKAYENLSRNKKLLEDEPHKSKNNPEMYKSCLMNLLGICLLSGRFDEIMPLIQTLRALPALIPYDKAQIFQRTYHVELSYRSRVGLLEGSGELIDEIEKGLEVHAEYIDEKFVMGLTYNVMMFLFLSGDFSRTLTWIDKLLLNTKFESVLHWKEAARVLLPVVHFELGNVTMVKPLIRSAQHYLQSRGLQSTFYQKYMSGLNKLAYKVQDSEATSLCQNLYDKLSQIVLEHPSPHLAFHEDLLIWLESRAEGISITEAHLRRVAKSRTTSET